MLSGEAHYRQQRNKTYENFNQIQKDGSSNVGSEFLEFLDFDISKAKNKNFFAENKLLIRSNRQSSRKCFEQQLLLESNNGSIVKYLQANINSILIDFNTNDYHINLELDNSKESLDALLIQLVIDYFTTLKEELALTKLRLNNDNMNSDILRNRAKTVRDIRIFALHLNNETKGQATLALLPNDSPQTLRCIKAVQDNSNFNFFENNLKNNEKRNIDINVLYVLKIEHLLLSKQLQNVASNSENGNIKGLFCMIPKQGLFAFCSYGLHASPIINNINYDTKNNKNKNNLNIIPGLFQQPWYENDVDDNNEGFKIAEKQANHGHKSLSNLRFSRYSTPYSFQSSLVNNENNNKCDEFLALCRVLVCKLKTLQSDITNDDIEKYKSNGFDAIYSSLTEEYVLLNKDYVLPEFIMQVKFDNIVTNFDNSRMTQSWLPKAFIPSNIQNSCTNMSLSPRLSTNYLDNETSSTRLQEPKLTSRSTLKLQSVDHAINILAQNESNYYNNKSSSSPLKNNQSSIGGVKKQNIVMSIQKLFNDFHNNKISLITSKASIQKKLYNNIKINLND